MANSKTNHNNFLTKYFFARSYKNKINRYLGDIRSRKIIDIGAGYGHFSSVAVKMGAVVEALEPRAECFPVLKKIISHRLYSSKVTRGLLDNNYYDIAVLISVIDEVDEKFLFLSEIISSVKKGGVLLIEVRNPNYFSKWRIPVGTDICIQEYINLFDSVGLRVKQLSGMPRPLTFGSFEIFIKTLAANLLNLFLPLESRQMIVFTLVKY